MHRPTSLKIIYRSFAELRVRDLKTMNYYFQAPRPPSFYRRRRLPGDKLGDISITGCTNRAVAISEAPPAFSTDLLLVGQTTKSQTQLLEQIPLSPRPIARFLHAPTNHSASFDSTLPPTAPQYDALACARLWISSASVDDTSRDHTAFLSTL